MNEQIGLSGILVGIKEMLVFNDKDTLKLLKTKMECAKSLLEGVIKELEPPAIPVNKFTPNTIALDLEANQAKKELR